MGSAPRKSETRGEIPTLVVTEPQPNLRNGTQTLPIQTRILLPETINKS